MSPVSLVVSLVVCGMMAAESSSERIVSEGLKPSPLEKNPQQLTDAIGGRVPGTPAFDQAAAWANAALKAAGADSIIPSSFRLHNTGRKVQRGSRSLAPISSRCGRFQLPGHRLFRQSAPAWLISAREQ